MTLSSILWFIRHEISVDRRSLSSLKNNEKLHILVDQLPESGSNTLNQTNILLNIHCYGLLQNNDVLLE